jgi:hypothetical protein
MTTKTASKKTMRKPASNTVNVTRADGEPKGKALAATALRPTVNAAVTMRQLSSQLLGDVDLSDLIAAIADQAKAVNGGDLKRAEGILITQAHTLDALFNNLARRSTMNMGEYMGAAETYMKLALRAQNQCRATLQTLGELKNPRPVAFVKQANISNGPQQVNNGQPMDNPHASHAHTGAHAEKNQSQPNELLEAKPCDQLDTRTPSTAGALNPAMATVGEVHRAADRGR